MTEPQVAPDYVHGPKTATFTQLWDLPDGFLKWYELRPPDVVITSEDTAAARDHLRSVTSDWSLDGDHGFVIHHRCGPAYLLLVCTWRENNELWETVYGNATGEYRIVDRADPHLATYCVWEMGIVAHEARAWSRYLRSPRTTADRRTYLADQFEGEV